ncbi:hypothetical protein [Pseudarthrobacter sp. S9]|uniref:hypothetical protein n=1 Tax=Pseudarthrobacter sp. S9 TaxID=3418421 RepID=UPI003D094249
MVRQGDSGTNGSRPKVSGSVSGGVSGSRKSVRKPGRAPLSPVYRRRRLFVGSVLLLVIAVAFGGFVAVSGAINGGGKASGQGSGGQPSGGSAQVNQPAGPAGGTPAASTAPAAAPTPTAIDGCDHNLVTVTAATDKPAYAAGEDPLLSLKVTNGNKVPCEVNIGTSQMEYLIISGSDRIFSSRDCQAESTELVTTIAPGQSETANFPWPRNRTVQGCTPIEAKPGAGGAYYVFTARLANKTSPKAVFQLN